MLTTAPQRGLLSNTRQYEVIERELPYLSLALSVGEPVDRELQRFFHPIWSYAVFRSVGMFI